MQQAKDQSEKKEVFRPKEARLIQEKLHECKRISFEEEADRTICF